MASEQRPTLPPREPRPMIIHFLVDSAVAFLAILILGLIWGIGWGVLLLVGVVIGAAATPFTRRAEERQLAARAAARRAASRVSLHTNPGVTKPRFRGISHLYAFVVSIAAAVALVATAPSGTATVAATVYAITLVGMFGASALYHRGNWSPSTARRLLQLDHTAIFLMIAGTYTPIALLATDGMAEAVLLPLVWLIAAGGILFEWLPIHAPRGYVTAVYLVLGWIGAFAMISLWDNAGVWCVLLVAAGGLCYTVGAIVHASHRPDPWPEVFGYHEIFHVLVIVAAAMHYSAIALFVLPLAE